MRVGIQSPEIFGEAFGDVAPLQRNQRVRLAGAAQRRGDSPLRPPQYHRLGGALEFDLELAHHAAHRAVDPAGQPAGQDVQRRFAFEARHQR